MSSATLLHSHGAPVSLQWNPCKALGAYGQLHSTQQHSETACELLVVPRSLQGTSKDVLVCAHSLLVFPQEHSSMFPRMHQHMAPTSHCSCRISKRFYWFPKCPLTSHQCQLGMVPRGGSAVHLLPGPGHREGKEVPQWKVVGKGKRVETTFVEWQLHLQHFVCAKPQGGL